MQISNSFSAFLAQAVSHAFETIRAVLLQLLFWLRECACFRLRANSHTSTHVETLHVSMLNSGSDECFELVVANWLAIRVLFVFFRQVPRRRKAELRLVRIVTKNANKVRNVAHDFCARVSADHKLRTKPRFRPQTSTNKGSSTVEHARGSNKSKQNRRQVETARSAVTASVRQRARGQR